MKKVFLLALLVFAVLSLGGCAFTYAPTDCRKITLTSDMNKLVKGFSYATECSVNPQRDLDLRHFERVPGLL